MDERSERGATATDLLAVTAAVALLLLLAAPVAARARDDSARTGCADRLRTIAAASIAYASDHGELPHIRGGRDDAPDDVGPALALLVREGYIDDASTFVCPASEDAPAEIDASAVKDFAFEDGDVRTTDAFSYGWIKARRPTEGSDPRTAISADRTAGANAGRVGAHRDGRHVLFLDGSVRFVTLDQERDEASPLGESPDDERTLRAALESLNLFWRAGQPPPEPLPRGPRASKAAKRRALAIYREAVAALGQALVAHADGRALIVDGVPEGSAERAKARNHFEDAKDGFDDTIESLGLARRLDEAVDPSIDELVFTAQRYGASSREWIARLEGD